MKHITKLLALLSVLVIALSACSPKLSDNVVASVNGVEITKEYYDKTVAKVAKDNDFEAIFGPEIWDMEIEQGVTFRQHFASEMLKMITTHEAVLQKIEKDDALKELLASDEVVQEQYDAYMEIVNKDEAYAAYLKDHGIDEEFIKTHIRRDLSYRSYALNVMENVEVTEEQLQAYYDEHIVEFTHNEVRASHILISTMDDQGAALAEDKKAERLELAQEVLLKAQNGEDFAELAKTYSEDPGSAALGGDLGFFSQGVMVPEFNDKAFAMEIGEISDLVETQYGYHILYLTDKNNEVDSFDSVKLMLEETLKTEGFEKEMKALMDSAKVVENKELIDVNI